MDNIDEDAAQDACEQGSHQHGDLTHVTQSGHDLRR